MKKTDTTRHVDWQELRGLAALFLTLGTTSFGGPVAHIARMEDEVVTRRKWLDRQHFVDLIGATNLIPGPNSTEIAIHIGQLRAGWPGLIISGTCFIVPAMLMVLALSWLYVRYGALPQAQWLMYGVKPVVIAVVAQALWKFARTALGSAFAMIVAIIALLLIARGVDGITVIVLAAAVGLVAGWWTRTRAAKSDSKKIEQSEVPPAADSAIEAAPDEPGNHRAPALIAAGAMAGLTPTLSKLFLVFLKFGCVIYGSGYVLLAFLRSDLVEHLHWLSDKQLIDAVAIGQVTPGPVFTTATFIGYQIAGVRGALVATLGIFLPSFLFVGLLAVLMKRLRTSLVMRKFLDSVNAASLALMAFVTYKLMDDAIVNVPTAAIALVALAILLRTRINSAWLIAAGALLGLVLPH